jgi:hypothetical protein
MLSFFVMGATTGRVPKAINIGIVILQTRVRPVMVRENILSRPCFAIVVRLIGRSASPSRPKARTSVDPVECAQRYL